MDTTAYPGNIICANFHWADLSYGAGAIQLTGRFCHWGELSRGTIYLWGDSTFGAI